LALGFNRFLIPSDGFQDTTEGTFLASLFAWEVKPVKRGTGMIPPAGNPDGSAGA
jgi:hypothetical protein